MKFIYTVFFLFNNRIMRLFFSLERVSQMKKLLSVIAIFVAIVTYYTASGGRVVEKSPNDIPKVGLLQLVSHNSLDQITEGIVDALNEAGYVDGETMELDFQNAQGDQNNLNTMGTRFVTNQSDVMIGIATPAVQSLANNSSDIPVVMGAVTDPIHAGLVEDLEQPGGNITGVRDVTPVAEQVDLIQQILPNIQTLGIIYSTGEINSVKQSEETAAYAKEQGIDVHTPTITSTNDLRQVAQNLAPQVDAIWVGTDNNVASAFPTLIEVANAHQIPVFPAVSEMVEEGGLATVGLNQYHLGVLTGEMAVAILQGEDPATMPIVDPKETEFIFNEAQAEKLGISIDESLLKEEEESR